VGFLILLSLLTRVFYLCSDMKNIQTFLLFLPLVLPATVWGQYYGVSNPITENWVVGANIGVGRLIADVETDLAGFQSGLYVQKSIAPAIDARVGFDFGSNTGLDLTPSRGFLFNSALNGERDSLRFYDSSMQVYHNYRMSHRQISFLFKFNLNRLFSPNGSDQYDIYALAGVGAFFYKTYTNVYDERTGQIYPYDSINTADPLGIRNQLKNLFDTSYETLAQQDDLNSSRLGDFILNTSFILGAGGRYKINENFALGLEGKILFVGDDLLDGQQFLETNAQSLNNDRPIHLAITFDYSFQ
jgi:hypothetical protein